MNSTAKERQEAREELLQELWLMEARAVKQMMETAGPDGLRASAIAAITGFLKLNQTNAAALTKAEGPGPLGGLAGQLPTFGDDGKQVTEATRVEVEEEERDKTTARSSGAISQDYLAEMPSFDDGASETPSKETVEK